MHLLPWAALRSDSEHLPLLNLCLIYVPVCLSSTQNLFIEPSVFTYMYMGQVRFIFAGDVWCILMGKAFPSRVLADFLGFSAVF